MSSAPIRIFDRHLQRQNLRRALRHEPARFLFDHAALELEDRLTVIKREFRSVLDLGSPLPALGPGFVREDRSLVRLAPLAMDADGSFMQVIGDEEALPFAPESFDLVVSVLALQAVNDLPGAFVQARHALKPDGLFLACLPGGRTLHELRHALTVAETEISQGASPRVYPFADVRDMGGLLQRAGFALPVADVEPLTVRYDTMFGLLRDLRAMGAANALIERSRKPLRRAILMRAAEIYAQLYSDPDGRVRATFELLFVSGWAPHESQQKPLTPGSAKQSLAEALGTVETKLKP